MATSVQAVTTRSVADGSGAFTVSGVFWLSAPANSVVPQPGFVSAVPNILPSDPIIPLGGQYAHVLGGSIDHPFQVPLVVPGPDRIFLTEFPNTATASNVAFGAFEYLQL